METNKASFCVLLRVEKLTPDCSLIMHIVASEKHRLQLTEADSEIENVELSWKLIVGKKVNYSSVLYSKICLIVLWLFRNLKLSSLAYFTILIFMFNQVSSDFIPYFQKDDQNKTIP